MIENFNLEFFLKYDIDSSDGGSIFMTPTGGCVKCAMLEACGYGVIGGILLKRGEGELFNYSDSFQKFEDVSQEFQVLMNEAESMLFRGNTSEKVKKFVIDGMVKQGLIKEVNLNVEAKV